MKGINKLIDSTPTWSAWLNLLSMSIFKVPYVDMAFRLVLPEVKGGERCLGEYQEWLDTAAMALVDMDWDIDLALSISNKNELIPLDLKYYQFMKARKKEIKYPWE